METAIVKLVVLFSARKDKGKEQAQSPGLLFKIRLLWPHLRGEGRAAVLRTVRGVFFQGAHSVFLMVRFSRGSLRKTQRRRDIFFPEKDRPPEAGSRI